MTDIESALADIRDRGLYRKLGVNDRSGAISVALREGVFQ